MGRKRKLTPPTAADKLSVNDAAAYVRETIERGLKHEPFTLRRESVDFIDDSDELAPVLVFYNGQRFQLQLSEVKND